MTLVLLSSAAWAQGSDNTPVKPAQEESGSIPIFRTAARLVLVDVLAQDPKTGLPLNSLRSEDFRVLDNQNEVPLTVFDSGAKFNTGSLALWFVVICNEKSKGPRGELGSGWFAGKASLFRPALDDLDKRDRVAVAHWCDDGAAQLDLRPTQDRDAAVTTLEQALRPVEFDWRSEGNTRHGELTLQKLIRLIIDDAHRANPRPLPVVLFLHSDSTGMPPEELNSLIDDFLETSGIVFGIKDADARDTPVGRFSDGELRGVLQTMAQETGGQYFSIHPNSYGAALQDILLQLHFRYELGFKPPALDGKRHTLTVEFVGPAKTQYKSVRLRYRPEYIPTK